MSHEDQVVYHQQRATHCRALASVAQPGAIRQLHNKLADYHVAASLAAADKV